VRLFLSSGEERPLGIALIEEPPEGTPAYERGQVIVNVHTDIDPEIVESGCVWG
jgi:hypothetical protein